MHNTFEEIEFLQGQIKARLREIGIKNSFGDPEILKLQSQIRRMSECVKGKESCEECDGAGHITTECDDCSGEGLVDVITEDIDYEK